LKGNGLDQAAESRQRDKDKDELARIEYARRLWDEATDPRGTAVEHYLRSRALELPADADRALRFNPRTPWRNENTGCTDHIPCIIVAFRSIEDDSITGVHRIRVDRPQHWPAADRKMIGPVLGAAVKIDPISGERLVVAEGIETTLAGRQLGLKPAWALGNAGAIGLFPVIESIDELVICAEPDKANIDAIRECGRRYRAVNMRVLIAQPRTGDMNDVLMERADGSAR
jgi:hypothetical protein